VWLAPDKLRGWAVGCVHGLGRQRYRLPAMPEWTPLHMRQRVRMEMRKGRTMTDEKQLTVRHESALDVYGSGDDIKTLAQRIKLCLPGGGKLSDSEALSLAQLSVAYELNPFNGEVWYIPGRGTMVGIKGLRKSARKQGNYWPTFDILGKVDKQALGIPENAIAYRCNIYRTDLLSQAAEAIDLMRKAGMANAFEVYAYKPAEGIGYVTPGESTKMKPDQAARKRAESDALKVAFDLPFASEVGNGNTIGYVDAEWSDVTDRKNGPTWPVDLAPEEDEPVAIFSDIQPEQKHDKPRPWSAEIVRGAARKRSGVWARGAAGDWSDAEPVGQDGRRTPASEKQINAVAGIMAAAVTRKGMIQLDIDTARHAVLGYIFDVASTNDLCSQECSAILDLWKEEGVWAANEYAVPEAAAIVAAWQKAAGQAELAL